MPFSWVVRVYRAPDLSGYLNNVCSLAQYLDLLVQVCTSSNAASPFISVHRQSFGFVPQHPQAPHIVPDGLRPILLSSSSLLFPPGSRSLLLWLFCPCPYESLVGDRRSTPSYGSTELKLVEKLLRRTVQYSSVGLAVVFIEVRSYPKLIRYRDETFSSYVKEFGS